MYINCYGGKIKMKTNLDKYTQDLKQSIKLGRAMRDDFTKFLNDEKPKKNESKPGQLFFSYYQEWYSEALEVVRQLLPNRLFEFERLYKRDPKRKKITGTTYVIEDWLLGTRSGYDHFNSKKYYEDQSIVYMLFQTQLAILESAATRFESSLFDIKKLVQADLFDSEIEIAKELLKKGFVRAAGAVAGVILEKHLSQVCEDHDVTLKKKKPTINDYNDTLKNNSIIEVSVWRSIQLLADLRNLCDHDKKREPKQDEIDNLIQGVNKVIKTIF